MIVCEYNTFVGLLWLITYPLITEQPLKVELPGPATHSCINSCIHWYVQISIRVKWGHEDSCFATEQPLIISESLQSLPESFLIFHVLNKWDRVIRIKEVILCWTHLFYHRLLKPIFCDASLGTTHFIKIVLVQVLLQNTLEVLILDEHAKPVDFFSF